MLSCLLIHQDISRREAKAEEILLENNLSRNHPDLLWFDTEEKLGVAQARQVKEFLSLKPHQGKAQAVVLIAAENLTPEAQNALLKTLEEPPGDTVIILGISSDDQLLPTVLSRCKVFNLENTVLNTGGSFDTEIEKLQESSMEKRFQFIESLDKRDEFLPALTAYFRSQILEGCDQKSQAFLKDLIEAERWARQNVNIRAILEYLMLRMPFRKKAHV